MRTPAFLALLLALLHAQVGAQAAEIEVIHIEANVGGATGGHSALKLGDHVYHYQFHPDGLLRLDRETWEEFRYRYAAYDNRTLEIATVPVSEKAFALVTRRLARLRVVQRRHLDRLAALELEERWFDSMADPGSTLFLRGVGLFDPLRREDPTAARLREAIAHQRGEDFLEQEVARSKTRLDARALEVSRLDPLELRWDAYPEPAEITAERRRDELLLREALLVLAEARPLAADALLDLADVDPRAADAGLSALERHQLARMQASLEDSVLRLTSSQRPDRGFALLVAAARHQAVQRSLAADRLLVLDPLPHDAGVLDRAAVARRRENLPELAASHRRAYAAARASALGSDEAGEVDYRLLEDQLARYYEVQGGAALGRAMRTTSVPLRVPDRAGTVAAFHPQPPANETRQAAAGARRNRNVQRNRLRAIYGYDLFDHNCATELARALVSAFPDGPTAGAALGGTLGPGDGLGFVPFMLANHVKSELAVASTREIPSLRQQRLARMAQRENPVLVGLREGNTLTARSYPGTEGDGRFLFFTDGNPLIRPILGALNLGYALGHSATGLLVAPFDRGRRLREALHGAVFSVPELFFVNIRKGTFEFVPQEAP